MPEVPIVEEVVSVSEQAYSDHGRRMDDTQDDGWTGSVHDTDSYGDPGFGSSDNWGVFEGSKDEEAAAAPKASPTDSYDLETFDPMAEFFGQPFAEFERGGEPPTEEVPSGVMEDLSEMYDSPMHVPDAPAVPGIVDRFTPAPVKQREGAPVGQDRPVFEPLDSPLPGETPPPAPAKKVPADKVPTPAPDLRRRGDEDDDDEHRQEQGGGGLPLPMILAGVGGITIIAVIVLVAMFAMGGFGGGTNTEPSTPVRTGPVTPSASPLTPGTKLGPDGLPIRSDLHGTTDGKDTEEEPTDEANPDEKPPEEPVTPEPAPAPAPEPVAAPTPKPKPKPAPPPVAKLGTLKVRANRKVLITINGKPEAYAPLDMPLTPGTYSVGAALPGRPDSEQVQQVTLDAGEIERVEFTF